MAKASFEWAMSGGIGRLVQGGKMGAAAMAALASLAASGASAQVVPGKYFCVSDYADEEELYGSEITIAAEGLTVHMAGERDEIYVLGESTDEWTSREPTSEDLELGMVSHRYRLFYDDLQKLTLHNELIYRDGTSQSSTVFAPQGDMLIAHNSFTEGTVSGSVISYCEIR